MDVKRLKLWASRQRRLIKRRGGLRAHIRLEKVFREIDRDPYVARTREKYKNSQ